MAVTARAIAIGIPADQREQIAAGLSSVLADSTVLYAKTHGFHWTALDLIAERIRALGFPAPYGVSTDAGL